ncbi:TMV resistance protein N-like isoform X3 [Juglans microcarpa x Juglans regia]|uniref:TMV resistance protein N-like isoform X3 n=1 Tax=Juglans microcarpa x Juglans regia TaxID=2249226 RepID=UPI001B7EFA96|nr:TMV resistance protein N-like isoform X3 [Juglans microcarpa x Juglans regia]
MSVNFQSMVSHTTQTSSSSLHEWGVFLSFHGGDTRQKFTAHLYNALEKRSLSTFRDDKELERGRYISEELLNAIENSMSAVVVLSPYYAFSRWCLTELVKIVECMQRKGLILLPVFYQVDPSHVRNQKGTFAEAFVKHENDPTIVGDDLQTWKSALSKVGNISGWDLRDRDESTVIEDIVGEILAKLNSTFSTVSKKLVGIDSRLEKLMNLYLNNRRDEVRFLGIWGMGGIGKTTLARAVYEKISSQFLQSVSSFIADVRERSGGNGGLVDLQKQLLYDLFKDKSSDIKDVDRGKNKIRHGLRNRRVLVVVDDVDQTQQLEALAIERDWFGGGSVIIITTRDKHLLIERGLAEDEIYRAKEFDDDEALQLFSWKAFKKELPLDGFVELSKQIIHYAKGLPLALEVLGRFLCRQNVDFWKSALKSLRQNPKKEIVDALKISFDGLEENEQKIFLDIACYFKGEMYVNRVKSILESCDYHPSCGIEILISKSLITISRGKLWMHDLLREMGHEIVRRQSQGDPGRQSRLWLTNDIIRVLKNNSGTNRIEGIVLNSPPQEELHLNSDVFSEMKNLRLLKIIGNVHLSQGLSYLSTELRVMEWHGYPLKSLPMSFRQPDKLFELSMCSSHIQQLWQGTKSLYKLEHVDLSDSRYLVETPDFTNAPNLKRLILRGCTKLRNLHSSVGALKRLILLNLKGCTSLTSLPCNISWDSLEILILSGCTRLWKFPETVGNMNRLRQLDLDGIALEELPSSIGHLTGLTYLSLRGCKRLLSLPSAICGLTSLKTLALFGCSQLEEMPEGLGNLEHLEELDLSETAIRQFPSSITRLQNLRLLSFQGCSGLPPKSFLKRLVTWFWGNPDTCLVLRTSLSSALCSLKKLDLSNCHLKDGAIPSDPSELSSLLALDLSGNDFTLLPESISQLSKLVIIFLRRCCQLQSLPELPSSTAYVDALDCISLETRSNKLHAWVSDETGLATLNWFRKPRRLKDGQRDLLKERTIKLSVFHRHTSMLQPEE